MNHFPYLAACSLVLIAGCKTPDATESDPTQTEVTPVTNASAGTSGGESEPTTQPASAPTSARSTVMPSSDQVAARVAESESRMAATPAGRMVWKSIEAHGGLDPWLSNGPLRFRFRYVPLSGPARDTYQTVSPWSSVARHQLADDRSVEFGWTGTQAWVHPPDADPKTNVRFWSLTPYYFVGIPFVLADPGVQYEQLPDATWEDKEYHLVKTTFEGVGDAPDDFYVIYIKKDTFEVDAIRYIVTYPGFFPGGGQSPEKIMAYDGATTVGGATFAASHRTFEWDPETEKRGELVTNVEVSDLAWQPDVGPDYFDAPEGAKILEGMK